MRQIVNRAEEHASFRTRHASLEEHLVVPLVATVDADQRGPVQKARSGHGEEDHLLGRDPWHSIVGFTHQRGISSLPLCELRVTHATAEMQQLVSDDAAWFPSGSHVSARPLAEQAHEGGAVPVRHVLIS